MRCDYRLKKYTGKNGLDNGDSKGSCIIRRCKRVVSGDSLDMSMSKFCWQHQNFVGKNVVDGGKSVNGGRLKKNIQNGGRYMVVLKVKPTKKQIEKKRVESEKIKLLEKERLEKIEEDKNKKRNKNIVEVDNKKYKALIDLYNEKVDILRKNIENLFKFYEKLFIKNGLAYKRIFQNIKKQLPFYLDKMNTKYMEIDKLLMDYNSKVKKIEDAYNDAQTSINNLFETAGKINYTNVVIDDDDVNEVMIFLKGGRE